MRDHRTAELFDPWEHLDSKRRALLERGWAGVFRKHLLRESFIGKFKDEFLDREIFDTLLEAQVLVERWRRRYNRLRPHSSLGYRAPVPEAIEPVPPGSGPLRQPALAALGTLA